MSTVKRPAAGGNLTLPAALAFAAISLPLSALGLSVGVQLPPYFASQLGVSLAVVGGAFGIVRGLRGGAGFFRRPARRRCGGGSWFF